jgi:SAM-dependent methyltransferase
LDIVEYDDKIYGLKFRTINEMNENLKQGLLFYHNYMLTTDQKIADMKKTLFTWGIDPQQVAIQLMEEGEKMLERALSISGWMTPRELTWLSEQAKKHERIVEVGSFMGRSTVALAETSGVVYAVDTFKGSEEHKNLLSGKPDDFLLGKFKNNLAGEISASKVYIIQAESCEAADILKGTEPDMVFIDAAHDYDSVKADIRAWLKVIVGGGLLCGYDYGNGTSLGLEKAVWEMVPGFKVMEHGSIWYAETPLNASAATA